GMEADVLQCDLEVADAYLELNLLPEAMEAYERAVAGFGTLGRTYEQARALAHLGVALAHAGRLDAAVGSLAEAAELFQAHGNGLWLNLVAMYQAALQRRTGQAEAAFEAANHARRQLNRLGARVRGASAALVAAEAAQAIGQPDQAERLYRSA